MKRTTDGSRNRTVEESRNRTAEETVVFDTNALMVPSQFGVDVFDEVERLVGSYHGVVPKAVIDELEKMSNDSDASVALDMTRENCEVLESRGDGHADDVIVEIASEKGWKVVTNDAGLKDRLVQVGVPVLYLRQRSYLEIEYPKNE